VLGVLVPLDVVSAEDPPSAEVPPVVDVSPVADELDEVFVVDVLVFVVDVEVACGAVAAPVVGTVNGGAPLVSEELPPPPQPVSARAAPTAATRADERRR
jgi:hypothetical protein